MNEQKPNHPGTGRYRNDAKQQWECWAVNQRTGEEVLLGYCAYSQGEQACVEWESRVWRAFLGIERERTMSDGTTAKMKERKEIRQWLRSYCETLAANARASRDRDDRVGYQYVLTLLLNFDVEMPTGAKEEIILGL